MTAARRGAALLRAILARGLLGTDPETVGTLEDLCEYAEREGDTMTRTEWRIDLNNTRVAAAYARLQGWDTLAAKRDAEVAALLTLCPHPYAVSDSDRGPHCPDCGRPLPGAA